MKIKGRFIAVLAAVGLLVALLPAIPTGAVAGVVSLTGGAGGKGAFFSDNDGYNVVNIQVTDADLSPARVGMARYRTHAADAVFDLKDAAVGGEIEKTEKLTLSDSTSPVTNQWEFTLADRARDRNEDGRLDEMDVSVSVDGQPLTAITQYDVTADTGLDGQAITAVTVIGVTPGTSAGSVVITYEITEYKFDVTTPLRLAGTEIHFGADLDNANNQVSVSQANSADATVTTTAQLSADDAAIVTFVYHVKDTAKDYVSVSTTTSGVTRKLTGTEATATTSVFESKIGVVESSDYTKLTTQAGNSLNDTDTANNGNNNGTVQISELDNSDGLGAALQGDLEDLAGDLGLNTSDSAQMLINRVISATHGDTLTVSYADASPAATLAATAKIDLEAPVVTLIQPSHKLFTRNNVVTLQATVVDGDAGVDSDAESISIAANFSQGTRGTPAPIQDGYTVTNVPGALPQGEHKWAILVQDRVGNTPLVHAKPAKSALGAAAPRTLIDAVGNPFRFTVDNDGPVLTGAETGSYLKNPRVTSGDKQETEAGNNREWVKATFNLGEGGAPLDPETVTATDFTVGGATPLEAVVNAKAQGSQPAGSIVYLKVAELDTSAKPAVRLTGEVRDKADNQRTDGSVASTSVADGLSPMITVTPSAAITSEDVTITVSSSERLRVNPTVQVTETKPAKDEALVSPQTLPVSLQTGALTTWVATYNTPTDSASIQYVVVTASDLADNPDTVGDASTTKDIISFQVDDAAPGLMFRDATGKALKDSKQQEGAVWIVAEFDDDEYTDDSYRKVSLSSVALTDGDGNVITDDMSDLFGANDVACGTGADGKCATYTLAIDLDPGKYNIAATGMDTAENSVSANVDFTVIKRAPFSLELKPGVNLISIPGSPQGDSGNLNILFEGEPVNLVTTFDRTMELAGGNPWLRSTRDPETGLFTGDISTLEAGAAYFVTADARTSIDITLRSVVGELPPTVMVRYGYNALGYSSIAPTPAAQPIDDYLNSIEWTVAYSYDPTPGRGWEVIRPGEDAMAEPGKGYLVYSKFDATLTP